MAARVTTIAAQKGGVGKTTVTVQSCLAAKLKSNARVLLIDVDPQCNSSNGLVEQEQRENSPYTVASMLYSDGVSVTPITGKYGIDVIPGDDGINAFPQELSDRAFSDLLKKLSTTPDLSANDVINEVVANQLFAFAKNVSILQNEYDYIFIDVPPSFLGLPLVSSLCAATDVIGLLEPTKYSSDVIGGFIEKVTSIKNDYNPSMSFHGFIINKFRASSTRHKQRVELWQEELGELLISSPIKINSWIEDRTEDSEPVFRDIKNSHQRMGSTMLLSAIEEVFPELGGVKS